MKRLLLALTVFLLALGTALAQRTITGTVSDDAGEPLIGASVRVDGTNRGAVTDVNGNFSVEVPNGATGLTVTYTGFDERKIAIGSSNVVDISMAASTLLQEAVITALGISRDEKSLGYGVSSVSGDNLKSSGEVNAIQGLAAKAPGIQVVGTGGTPGASSKILIRGNSTFTNNNQPLIIVDGIPYDNQTLGSVAGDYPFNANLSGVNNSNRAIDLNPNDIESVTVLKGQAAAALYGSRAANGVIIYTTKKGQAGKLRVSVNSSVAFDEVNKLPALQMEYGQGSGGGQRDANGVVQESGAFQTLSATSAGTANSWGPKFGSDPNFQTAYDNLGNFFETGVTLDNNIAFTGGTEKATFRLALGNVNQTGIVPNTELDRNSVRLNASVSQGKFKVGATAAYVNTAGQRAQNGSNLSGVMLSLTRMPASFDVYGGDGTGGYENRDGSQHQYFLFYDNPAWSSNNNVLSDNTNRVTGGLEFTYDAFDWMKVLYRVGADVYGDRRKQVWAIGSWDPPTTAGEVWENTKSRQEYNSDFIVTFDKQFDVFDAALSLGSNLNHREDNDNFARGRNLAVPNFYNLSNASELYTDQGTIQKRLAGLFFDLNLGFRNMLYLGVTGRQDWASTFGKDRRENGFFYPSANLGFVFSELLDNRDLLSFGKIRGSVARAGVEPGAYQTLTYFTKPFLTDGFTDGFGFPFLGQNGFGYSATLGNADLLPEIVDSWEIGTELKFWNGRLGLDLGYYNQESKQLLVARPIASSSGFRFVNSNTGRMVNKGLEIELTGTPVKSRKFNWDVVAGFARNVNEVLELPEGVDEINIESAFASIGSFAIVNQPYGALYGTRWQRNDAGRIIVGANGIPLVDPTRGNIGNPFPDWTGYLRNSFSFFDFTVSGLLDVREGGDIWGGTLARLHRLGRTQESADNRNQTFVVDGVVEQADGSFVENTTAIDAFTYYNRVVGDAGAATESAVFDGSWIRLREVKLEYQLPATRQISNWSLYATGRNLWLNTDYPGVDPETSLTGAGSNVSGFDYFNMPSTKSYLVGLRLDF